MQKPGKASAAKMLAEGLDAAAYGAEDDTQGEDFKAKFEDLQGRFTGLQSAKDKEIDALGKEVDALKNSVTDLEAKLAKATSDFDGATALLNAEKDAHAKTAGTLAETSKQCQLAEARHQQLTGDVLSKGNAPKIEINTWQEAEKQHGYIEARRKHPDLYEAFMAPHQKKKGV
jgi:predicted  nucleic acid-binding Zn-ribbon protein